MAQIHQQVVDAITEENIREKLCDISPFRDFKIKMFLYLYHPTL
jgi:hypothetical protein